MWNSWKRANTASIAKFWAKKTPPACARRVKKLSFFAFSENLFSLTCVFRLPAFNCRRGFHIGHYSFYIPFPALRKRPSDNNKKRNTCSISLIRNHSIASIQPWLWSRRFVRGQTRHYVVVEWKHYQRPHRPQQADRTSNKSIQEITIRHDSIPYGMAFCANSKCRFAQLTLRAFKRGSSWEWQITLSYFHPQKTRSINLTN